MIVELNYRIYSFLISLHDSKTISEDTKDIAKTCLFKYIENFTTKKLKVLDKIKSDIFHISAQNIDSGYSLEPPRRGGSNEYPQYFEQK